MLSNRAQDEALQIALDRQAKQYEVLAAQARKDRRAVWLRLVEEHGCTYEQLAQIVGKGETTIWGELKRARTERQESDENSSSRA